MVPVDVAERQPELADDVVFGEPVEVEHLQHRRRIQEGRLGNLGKRLKGSEAMKLMCSSPDQFGTVLTGTGNGRKCNFRFEETCSHLELELFVEDGVQSVPQHSGLAGSGFVGQNVDLDVRVRASSHVHGLQAVGIFDSHRELERKRITDQHVFTLLYLRVVTTVALKPHNISNCRKTQQSSSYFG